MSFSVSRPLLPVVIDHLCRIYPDEDNNALASRILEAMHLEQDAFTAELHQNKWSESDLWVITYGDSILHPDEAPVSYTHLRAHET